MVAATGASKARLVLDVRLIGELAVRDDDDVDAILMATAARNHPTERGRHLGAAARRIGRDGPLQLRGRRDTADVGRARIVEGELEAAARSTILAACHVVENGAGGGQDMPLREGRAHRPAAVDDQRELHSGVGTAGHSA